MNTPQRAKEPLLSPAVDIFEGKDHLLLLAELPGVNKESLKVNIDGVNLRIEGSLAISTADGDGKGFEEVRSPYYQRFFQLSDDLEAEKLTAKYNHGLLTLTIPKKAKSEPRRIKVQTD